MATKFYHQIIFIQIDDNAHQVKLMEDLMDFRNETLITEIRRTCSSIKFCFDASLNTSAQREAFFYFIGNFTTNFECLVMHFDDWNENEIGKFFTTIRSSDIKVCEFLFLCKI